MTTTDAAAASTRRSSGSIEWPTLVLAGIIHGGWAAATLWHHALAWPLRLALGGWLIAWHGSLQHEVIHGHPTPWRRVNGLIGAAPLSLWLPFARYRQSHLGHHATEDLTQPGLDPESRYFRPESGRLAAVAGRLQATLVGRLLAGPLIEVAGFLAAEGRLFLRGDRETIRIWSRHAVAAALVMAWLTQMCRFTLADYVLTFVYPGLSLTLLRSFAEHRAADLPGHRVAIVERAPILGLLFLNNNLHAVHHSYPAAPWYRLPALYRRERPRLLRQNGGLVYRGYREVFARFAARAHDDVFHPFPSLAGRPVTILPAKEAAMAHAIANKPLQRSYGVFALVLSAMLLAASPAPAKAQSRPSAEPPYQVEWVYRIKYGYQEEWWRIFQKYQIAILDREQQLGYVTRYSVVRPGLHTSEDSRWDYRIVISYPNQPASTHEGEVERQVFADRAALEHDEQRRWELTLNHWDLPIHEIDPHKPAD
jgi:fatty acid desaturase